MTVYFFTPANPLLTKSDKYEEMPTLHGNHLRHKGANTYDAPLVHNLLSALAFFLYKLRQNVS
jgi:hypothetical protein